MLWLEVFAILSSLTLLVWSQQEKVTDSAASSRLDRIKALEKGLEEYYLIECASFDLRGFCLADST
jgi:hypothetical protein